MVYLCEVFKFVTPLAEGLLPRSGLACLEGSGTRPTCALPSRRRLPGLTGQSAWVVVEEDRLVARTPFERRVPTVSSPDTYLHPRGGSRPRGSRGAMLPVIEDRSEGLNVVRLPHLKSSIV